MSVLIPVPELTLGNYEQRVILELDNRLTWPEVKVIIANDPNFRLVFSIIHNSYEQNNSIKKCIEKIYIVFEPALCGSVTADATD